MQVPGRVSSAVRDRRADDFWVIALVAVSLVVAGLVWARLFGLI
jgi:hypothetical protein